MRQSWQDRLNAPLYEGQFAEHAVLLDWCDLTDNYWRGLFHCYSDPRIPGTNNDLERHIKQMKQLERAFSLNPNPAARFIAHAATNALAVTHPKLPDEAALAKFTPEDVRQATAQIKARRKTQGIAQRVRRKPIRFADGLLERWRDACQHRESHHCASKTEKTYS